MDIGRREPNADELAKLKKVLPFLKKQVEAKAAKNGTMRKAAIGRMIDPKPCQICVTTYDRYNHGKEPHDFCKDCRDKLAGGQVAFVTKSLRYIFAVPDPNAPAFVALKGTVVHISEDFMDKWMAKHEQDTSNQ